MNIRCSFCQMPFVIGRNEMLAAIQMMGAENLHHYDAHCPRCRRANPISRERIEWAFPNWRQALQELEASTAQIPAPQPVAVAQPEPKPAHVVVERAESEPAPQSVTVAEVEPEPMPAPPPAAKVEKKPVTKATLSPNLCNLVQSSVATSSVVALLSAEASTYILSPSFPANKLQSVILYTRVN